MVVSLSVAQDPLAAAWDDLHGHALSTLWSAMTTPITPVPIAVNNTTPRDAVGCPSIGQQD